MQGENTQKELKNEIQNEYGKVNNYIFSSSISRRKTVNGKTYLVRSYFIGGKDFEETIKRLAVQKTLKEVIK